MSIRAQRVNSSRPGELRKVLFLASNPEHTDQLAIEHEFNEVRRTLDATSHRDGFERVAWMSAESWDLLEPLRRVKPSVLHLTGHGFREPNGKGKRGFVFHGKNGTPQRVPWRAVGEAILAAGDWLQL